MNKLSQTVAQRFLRIREQYPARPIKPIKANEMHLPEKKAKWIREKLGKYNRGIVNRHTLSAVRAQEMLTLLEQFPKRKFDGVDLVAALIRQHGLEREKLLPYVNALNNIAVVMRQNNSSPISVSTTNLTHVVKQNLLKRALNVTREQARPQTTTEIMKKLNVKNRGEIIYALLILEEAGEIAGLLPETGNRKGGPENRWVCRQNRKTPQTLPQNNNSYNILMRLANGPKEISDLALPKKFFNTPIGNPHGVTTATRVRYILADFVAKGLVTTRQLPSRRTERGIPGGKRRTIYELTEKGRELAEKQRHANYLLPQTKQTLLSALPKTQIPPALQKRLELMEKVIGIRMAYEEAMQKGGKIIKRGLRPKIAKRFGTNVNFVMQVNNGLISPWEGITFETAAGIYLPALQEKNPPAAQWLKNELVKFEKFYKRRKTKVKTRIPSTRLVDNAKFIRSIEQTHRQKALTESSPEPVNFRNSGLIEHVSKRDHAERSGTLVEDPYEARIKITKLMLKKQKGAATDAELVEAMNEEGFSARITHKALGHLRDLGAIESSALRGKKVTHKISDYWRIK